MILTFLEDLKDHRRPQGQRYELNLIVLFSIMAFLSNAKSYRDISRFITGHYTVLKKYFSLRWKKPPGYTTIRNILQGVDSQKFEACFRAYTQSILDKVASGEVVSIAFDGKTLRGSYDNTQDKKALQIVFMFRTDSKLLTSQ
jgi:tRNA U34 2-thiouridine synthase MnmA/TrmU